MRRPIIQILQPLVSLVLLGLALVLLYHQLHRYHYRDVVEQVRAIAPRRIWAGIGLTALSYWVLTCYEAFAFRYIQYSLTYPRIALAAFIGYVFSHNLTVLGGGAARYRVYSAWGITAIQTAKIVTFCGLTFWLGFLALGGGVFVACPSAAPGVLPLPPAYLVALGIGCLVLVAAYLGCSAFRRGPYRIRGWEFTLPPLSVSLIQILIASADWTLAGAVLYALLPPAPSLTFLSFLSVFLLSQLVGLISHVPGGVGVLETVIVYLLSPTVPVPMILGSLLVYRAIYYVAPLAIAATLLGVNELIKARLRARRVAGLFSEWTTVLAPRVLALAIFLGGAILLWSGALPSGGRRLAWLHSMLPLPALELSHFLGSLVGVALLLLARGLQRRLDSAYLMSVGLLAAGIVFSLLKGFDVEEAIILGATLIVLLPCRREFYRRGSLISQRFTPGWIAAIAIVVLSAAWLGLFVHKHVDYSNELWWRFALRGGGASRSLRATVGAVGGLLAFGLWNLLRPAPPAPSPPGVNELAKAREIVARSPRASAALGLLGDKQLLFNGAGTGFVMYGVAGRSWISMGEPVGPDKVQEELAWEFHELVDLHGGWTVFYEVAKESLHLYLELGLTLLKLGEEGRVQLPDFSLEGGPAKEVRQAHGRAAKAGCSFEVATVETVPALLADFRAISDGWLELKNTREKGFSLGYFDEAYLRMFPAAIVRREGRIVAFANIWQAAEKEELSIDLMRYLPDEAPNLMDYLFVELMQWGRGQGYRWFNMGMAPLAGIEGATPGPRWNRIAEQVYRHGEHFYNFQGLRRYKEKFGPVWEPRYLACPSGLALPQILVNLAALTSRGLSGVVGK